LDRLLGGPTFRKKLNISYKGCFGKGDILQMVKKWVKRGGRGGYPQKCQKVPFLGGSKGGKRGKKGGEGGVPSKTPTFGLKKGGVAGI